MVLNFKIRNCRPSLPVLHGLKKTGKPLSKTTASEINTRSGDKITSAVSAAQKSNNLLKKFEYPRIDPPVT
jgi:hypothetical protein